MPIASSADKQKHNKNDKKLQTMKTRQLSIECETILQKICAQLRGPSLRETGLGALSENRQAVRDLGELSVIFSLGGSFKTSSWPEKCNHLLRLENGESSSLPTNVISLTPRWPFEPSLKKAKE